MVDKYYNNKLEQISIDEQLLMLNNFDLDKHQFFSNLPLHLIVYTNTHPQ